MKGFLACALAAVPRLATSSLARPVVLAFSHDEELGCLAAPTLARHLVAHQPTPSVVITGEPTSMRVVRAHKAVRVLRTVITGRVAHSARTDLGASAVMAAARLVTYLEELGAKLAAFGPHSPGLTPAYTTINVGTISGGQALNIVPGHCSIVWEYRSVPGSDPAAPTADVAAFIQRDLLPRLHRTAPEADIVTEVVADVPALDPRLNGAAAALLESIGDLHEGPPVAYATDGSALQEVGLPTVVCGPGSMAQGHQPDEFIEVSELDRCARFLDRVGAWCTTN